MAALPRCHTCERTGFFPSVKPRTVPRAAAAPQGYGNVGECNSFSGDSGIPAATANHFAATAFSRRLTPPLMCNYHSFISNPTP
ncbi:protein of unknown function [Cupriavidus taiwanensis]|nr:protein of unknown function [Cupriavidus taiwanensis]